MDYAIARRTALRLLSMRNYHSLVLARKLEKKGCPSEIAERVIEDCKRIGLIKDDDAILREFRRGYGPKYIEFHLRLEKSEVRALITREMQKEKIKELKSKFKEREKGIRTMQRRGFDLDLAIEVFSTF